MRKRKRGKRKEIFLGFEGRGRGVCFSWTPRWCSCCHCVASSPERWRWDASALRRRPSDGAGIRAHAAAAADRCSAASWVDRSVAVDARGCGSYHARFYARCNRACKLWRPCVWSWRRLSSRIKGKLAPVYFPPSRIPFVSWTVHIFSSIERLSFFSAVMYYYWDVCSVPLPLLKAAEAAAAVLVLLARKKWCPSSCCLCKRSVLISCENCVVLWPISRSLWQRMTISSSICSVWWDSTVLLIVVRGSWPYG